LPTPSLTPPPLSPRLLAAFHAKGDLPVDWHSHETAELVYVAEGELRIDVGDARLPGEPGTLYILPPTSPHAQLSRGDWHTLCVLFEDHVRSVDTSPRTVETSRDGYLVDWLNHLCALSNDPERRSRFTEDCLLLTVLARIAQIERDKHAKQGLPQRYLDAVAYLHRNTTHAVSADELSAATHTSYSHLGQLFRQLHGCGPLQYHQRLRMEHACRVLLNPYTTITDAAHACGYTDPNHFARTFTKTFGIPPGRWRKDANPRADAI
jgi:AraC-like DNA-binding protein